MKKDFINKLKENLRAAKSILAFCNKHQAEILPTSEGFIVHVPRKLEATDEAELQALIPDKKPVHFEVSPKIQTKMNIDNLIHRAQPSDVDITPDLEHRTITIKLEGVGKDEPVWGELSEALKMDGYFDSWKFIVEGKEVNVLPKMSEELAKNQSQHTKGITDSDITDLKIGLANAQTVDDILKAIGG
jgi:hypothetical protein